MIENLPGEEWRDIAGYDGRYQISNKGRIKSLVRREPAIMRPNTNGRGYLIISFNYKRVRKSYMVHRLVLMAFCPIDNPNQMEGNHIDFNVKNACLENLEWATRMQNIQHFVDSGRPLDRTKTSGAQHHLNRVTEADVLEIRRLCGTRKRGIKRAVARQFNIHIGTVDQIVSGRTWKHLLPGAAA